MTTFTVRPSRPQTTSRPRISADGYMIQSAMFKNTGLPLLKKFRRTPSLNFQVVEFIAETDRRPALCDVRISGRKAEVEAFILKHARRTRPTAN